MRAEIFFQCMPTNIMFLFSSGSSFRNLFLKVISLLFDYEPEDLVSQNQKFCHLHAADLKGSHKAIWDLGITKIWSPFITGGGGGALSFFSSSYVGLDPASGGGGALSFSLLHR